MLEDKNQKKTELSQLGEYQLKAHLTKNFKNFNASTEINLVDDAAVLDFKDAKTVVSSNLFVEGVHFDLSYMPLRHLGYKSVVAAISNVCAMNAKPTQISVSVAVSNRFPLEAVEELFDGIYLVSNTYKIDFITCETTSSQKGLIISVTAIGEANDTEIVKRSGAKATDLLVVSGDLGAAYMGLQVLEREKQVFQVNPNSQPDLEPYTYLVERQLKPEARTDIRTLLFALELKPTSMIAVTDGLSSDLLHICKQSNVGCQLYEEKIPVDPQFISVCEEFQLDSTTVAINGGEDYELLFTIALDDFDKIKANPNFTIIGHITPENDGVNLVTRANTQIPIKSRGWGNLEENK